MRLALLVLMVSVASASQWVFRRPRRGDPSPGAAAAQPARVEVRTVIAYRPPVPFVDVTITSDAFTTMTSDVVYTSSATVSHVITSMAIELSTRVSLETVTVTRGAATSVVHATQTAVVTSRAGLSHVAAWWNANRARLQRNDHAVSVTCTGHTVIATATATAVAIETHATTLATLREPPPTHTVVPCPECGAGDVHRRVVDGRSPRTWRDLLPLPLNYTRGEISCEHGSPAAAISSSSDAATVASTPTKVVLSSSDF